MSKPPTIQLKPSPTLHSPLRSPRQNHLLQILKGNIRYLPCPLSLQDLQPQLVIKINIPKQQTIPLRKKVSVRQMLNNPIQELLDAQHEIQMEILNQMQQNRQFQNKFEPVIRFNTNLKLRPFSATKQTKYIDKHQEQQLIQFQCAHQLVGKLDLFTVQFNGFMYVLQQICGFRTKVFLLSDQNTQKNALFVLLSLSPQNLIRVASNYRIKKELQYTFFDFYLNEPTDSSRRPLSFHSSFKTDPNHSGLMKKVKRYFDIQNRLDPDTFVMQQADISALQAETYLNYNQETQYIMSVVQQHKQQLTSYQKQYLYYINRGKLNLGCQKMFSRIKQRKQFFELNKSIASRYGYKVLQQPAAFQQFYLASNKTRGNTFFKKLQNMLMFKPQVTQRHGKLQLFLNMQKSKLCFLLLKSYFKVSYLQKVGFDVFALDHPFEKFGSKTITNQCLVERWPIFGVDSKAIRNYMGEQVAHQILIKTKQLNYFVVVAALYTMLNALQIIYQKYIWVYTSFAQIFIISITFKILISYWKQTENDHIKNYCENVSSKISLNTFRGPYRRDLINDDVDVFVPVQDFWMYASNLLCSVLMLAQLVILGAIFHGCRLLVVTLYMAFGQVVYGMYFSFAHLIGYTIFFIIQKIYQQILIKLVIRLMIYIKNPPSDQLKRHYKFLFSFFYVVGIQLLAPLFFMILEPFSGVFCYANSCQNQLRLYVISRYIIVLGSSLTQLVQVLLKRSIQGNLEQLPDHQSQCPVFQQQLADLLQNCFQQSQKPKHKQNIRYDIINFCSFTLYSLILPVSPLILSVTIFVQLSLTRFKLLYKQRRPLNQSHSINRFASRLEYMYYIGLVMNSWMIVDTFDFVNLYWQSIIQAVGGQITQQKLFLIKLISAILLALVFVLLGLATQVITKNIMGSSVQERKQNKYKEYMMSHGTLKLRLASTEQRTPLTSVFRTCNNPKSSQEVLNQQLYGIEDVNASSVIEQQTLSNLLIASRKTLVQKKNR